MSIDIISSKSLERQIKVLEDKIGELQDEAMALERKREACHILLGIPIAPISTTPEAAVTTAKKNKKKSPAQERTDEEAAFESSSSDHDVIGASDLR